MAYTNNIIPIMTSNTTPSGLCFGNGGNEANGYYPYKVFDSDNYTDVASSWANTGANYPNYVGYKFTQPKKVAKYSIRSLCQNQYFAGNTAPKTFTFEGSNDNTNWVALDTRTNEINWILNERREYTFTNTNSYYYYRLRVTANAGGPYLMIQQIEMMEIVPIKYLIQQHNNYYSVKPEYYNTTDGMYIPIPLSSPPVISTSEIETYAFDDISLLETINAIGQQSFKPIDKLYGTFEIKMFKHK